MKTNKKFFESVADLKYLGRKVNLYLYMPSRHCGGGTGIVLAILYLGVRSGVRQMFGNDAK